MRSRGTSRATRARLVFAALIALAPLFARFHLADDSHAICATHGELEHGAHAHPTDADVPAAPRWSEPAAPDEHADRCGIWLLHLGTHGVATGAATTCAQLPRRCAAAARPPAAPVVEGPPLWMLAPKASPPVRA